MVKNKAFTLVEIMVVLLIVGFLVAFVGRGLVRRMAQSKVEMTKLRMSKIKSGLIEYNQAMGRYPKKQDGGLNALLERPNTQGKENWDGPYVDGEDDLEDKWNESFEYNCPPLKYKTLYRFFEIISGGDPQDAQAQEIYTGA